ncbi:MAG: hypothetical protein QMD99_23220 [Rhizobiaceae bacterium]|nr:hypothetical protein [Rhizobiaceae bacterium]
MSSDAAVIGKDITFEAADGFPLKGTLFAGTGEGPLALISSAAAVPRGFYSRFATYLVQDRGFRAVLTYDYRGVAASKVPSGWKRPPLMADWAEKDMPAAVDALDALALGHPMVGVGQSFGGQALGLSGRHRRFLRYLMVAVMSGHWRYTDVPLKVFTAMNLIGVPLAMITGRVPGWIGLGETLPGSVFRQWARWGRNPEYFFADLSLDAARRYGEVETPILALGLTDDPWGTPRAQQAILKHYVRAPQQTAWISPASRDTPIGHLGFFRSAHRERLWKPTADWLEVGAGSGFAARETREK